MSNHYHLLLRTDEASLSEGMQSLNARYAEHFNLAYELTGHVFQDRFDARLIKDDQYLLAVVRYVERNAVAAGLCTHPSEWPWSSYGAVLGYRSHTEWFDREAVLSSFAPDRSIAIARFVDFIAQGDDAERLANTPLRRARADRDRAIRATYAAGTRSVRTLAKTFHVSPATVVRALRCFTEGSDPSVKH